jgi:hypothetical protein
MASWNVILQAAAICVFCLRNTEADNAAGFRMMASHTLATTGFAYRKVAYYKTHKTASTSLGAVIFRYSAKRSLRIFARGNTTVACAGPVWTNDCDTAHVLYPLPAYPRTADVVLHHVSHGTLEHSFLHLLDWYGKVLGDQFITIIPLRQPTARFVSWYNFFVKGKPSELPAGETLDTWVASGKGANGFALELGLSSEAQVDEFIKNMTLWRASAARRIFWFPTEEFDDALLMLGHRLSFNFMDLLNDRLFENRAAPVSAELQNRIEQQIGWDKRIYEAALSTFQAERDEMQRSSDTMSWDTKKEMMAKVQAIFQQSMAQDSCAQQRDWYQMGDLAYEGQISSGTLLAPVPGALRNDAMLRAFADKQRFC